MGGEPIFPFRSRWIVTSLLKGNGLKAILGVKWLFTFLTLRQPPRLYIFDGGHILPCFGIYSLFHPLCLVDWVSSVQGGVRVQFLSDMKQYAILPTALCRAVG